MTRMRRSWVVSVVVVATVVFSSTPALAWSNGTEGCNSYGTHDWVLDQALQAVGEQADWVKTRVALRATDDPDCKDGIDHASGTWWHVYDRWGDEWGGADEATAVWFRRTKNRLANGNERGASRALGIMSHFVADVANPMHTDSSEREDGVHSSYESAVDRRIFDDYSFNYNGEDPAKAGPKTRAVARKAHRYYWDLVRAYDNHSYNAKVHRITKRQLNRAANALADLIAAF
jgi:hypothetical protein